MKLSYLKEFYVLAHTRNYLEAAEELYISQSTLSKHIIKLEEILSVSLFDRSTRKVELSHFGKILLPYAEQILKIEETYTQKITLAKENRDRTIYIGAIPALAQYKITDITMHFQKNNPNYKINIIQTDSDTLYKKIESGELDVAFIRETTMPQDHFIRVPYFSDHFVVMLSNDHLLANQKSLSLYNIKDEQFLTIGEDSFLTRIITSACKEAGFEPNFVFKAHQIDTLINFAKQEYGIIFMLEQLAYYHKNEQLTHIDIEPLINTTISLIYQNKNHSPVMKDMIEKFIESTNTIKEQGFNLEVESNLLI